jgi:hypothetical protein
MALGSKTSKKFYTTSGGGADEIDSTRKSALDAFNTADSAAGYKQLIDDNTLGPLIVNLQEMQDDIDELRRFIVANEPKVGSTFDATTDFTVGSTVVTDDQIQFTPSTSDTATISATTDGNLNLATVDGSGNKEADITLNALGNINLAVATATHYVDVNQNIRSGNQGDIQYVSSEYYIPITATDFLGLADARGGCAWGMELNGTWISHGRQPGFVEKLIPLGFKATGCIVYGEYDGSGDNQFRGYEGAINANTNTAQGTAKDVGTASDFTTDGGSDIVGDGVKTCRIVITINEARDQIFGGKIILEKV